MRRIYCRLFAVLLVGVLMCGCKKTDTWSYCNLIPEEAAQVAGIKVKRIMDKAGAEESVRPYLEELMENKMSGPFVPVLEEFLKGGKETGLDLGEDIFIFGYGYDQVSGVVAKVNNITKLKETITGLNNGDSSCIKEKEGYCKVIVGDELVFVFNKTSLLCTRAEKVKEGQNLATLLISGKIKGGIMQKEVFRKIITANNDISFFVASEKLYYGYMKLVMAVLPENMDLSRLYVVGGVNFDRGKVSLLYEILSTNPEDAEKISKVAGYSTKMNNRFLTHYPLGTYLYMGMNMKNGRAFGIIDEFDLWRKLGIDDERRENTRRILSSFTGDFSLGITGILPSGTPALTLLAEVKDTSQVNFLARKYQSEHGTMGTLRKTGETDWEFAYKSMNMTFYFGVNQDIFYLTTDKDARMKIGQVYPESLLACECVNGLKMAYSGGMINIEQILSSPIISMGIYMIGGSTGDLIYNVLSQFSYVDAYMEEPTRMSVNIHMKNQKENSLKTLIRMLDFRI